MEKTYIVVLPDGTEEQVQGDYAEAEGGWLTIRDADDAVQASYSPGTWARFRVQSDA